MLRIVVAAVSDQCPAVLALRMEGFEPEVTVMEDDLHYGRFLREHWARGAFINVEHDVAPWPGAIQQLWDCREPFCGFGYPVGTTDWLIYSMGCIKFGQELLDANPGLPDRWQDEPWTSLDGKVVNPICEALGVEDFHRHGPPVAHVREPR